MAPHRRYQEGPRALCAHPCRDATDHHGEIGYPPRPDGDRDIGIGREGDSAIGERLIDACGDVGQEWLIEPHVHPIEANGGCHYFGR